jgi:hypothetical protein
MIETRPNRSETTAWDGRPVCAICGRPYTSLRIVIRHKSPRHGKEACQSCRQIRRLSELRKARGW